MTEVIELVNTNVNKMVSLDWTKNIFLGKCLSKLIIRHENVIFSTCFIFSMYHSSHQKPLIFSHHLRSLY